MELVTGHSIAITHPEAVVLVERLVICRDADRTHRVFDSSSVCQFHDLSRPQTKK
jgi:hypothetical protein